MFAELLRLIENPATEVVPEVEAQRLALEDRKRRLIRLYELGEVTEEYFLGQLEVLNGKQHHLGRYLTGCKEQRMDMHHWNSEELQRASAAVERWVLSAGESQLAVMVRAMQLQVKASNEKVELTGVIPEDYAPLCNDADLRAMVT